MNQIVLRRIIFIHYRSDTDASLILGETTALSILRDQAQTFNGTWNYL